MIGVLIVGIIILALVRIAPASTVTDYMSPAATKTVNGFFVICVFFRHIFQYRDFPGNAWVGVHWIDHHLGQFIVVSFLFFSGYGIMESWKKKGMPYIRQLPTQRVWKTWIRFVCCVLIYLVVALIQGERYPADQLPSIFLGWESVGNSNWYIFVILCLYLLTWLAFLLAGSITKRESDSAIKTSVKQKKKTALYAMIIHLILAVILGWILFLYQDRYWYNTILVYTAGMAFSWFRPAWDRLMTGQWLHQGLFLGAEAVLLFLCYRYQEQILAYQLAALLFAGFICWFMGRIYLRSPVLEWMGEHLFGIYMMQRVPMILLEKSGLSDPVFLLICAAGTLILGWAIHVGTSRLIRGR